MAAHAKLSPSGAARWMKCPGSVVLEADYKDEGSIFADEGTAAHTLAAYCLEDKTDAIEYLGENIHVGERKFPVTKDMARYVQMYVDYVRKQAEGKMLFVEQKVPIGHLTGEQGATGTSDAIIVDVTNGHIEVVDLKYGMGVEVDAEGNEQAQMYGLGSLEECDMLAQFTTASLTIFQPRIRSEPSTWHTSVDVLHAFAEEVAAASDTVRAAGDIIDTPKMSQDEWDEAYLNPTEKGCKFCKAKSSCPALRAEVLSAVGDDLTEVATAEDFAALSIEPVSDKTSDNWLPVAMSKVDLIEQWVKSVRAEVERRMLAGQTVDGYKLVQGRAGPRKWSNPDAAEELFKSFRLKSDEMYDKTLISPTTAEKLLKDTPRRWAKVNELVARSSGKLSVAPATDKRPAVAVTATAEDFSALVENAE